MKPERPHQERIQSSSLSPASDPWDGLPVYPVGCRVWQKDEGAFALFELPFAPFVGLMIDQLPGDLTIEVTCVRWNTRERRFHIDAICDGGHANAVAWLIGKGWKPLEPPF